MFAATGISGGPANWSSGFLPAVYTGVRLRGQGDPILNVTSPAGVDAKLQRDSLDLIAELNRRRLAVVGDPEIGTRVASYEMAFRLQTSAPELLDLTSETKATLELYGADPYVPSFARACLLARRMLAAGPLADLVTEADPGPDVDLDAAIRAGVIHYWHPVGTCAMGDVTDARGRIPGLEGLFVADASLMPRTVRATTNLPTVVIGDTIASFLVSAAG